VKALGVRRPAAGSLALAAILAAGCGGAGSSSTTASSRSPTSATTAKTTTASPPTTSAPRRSRPRGAPVGATQRVHAGSSTLAVTVDRVIDPLTDSGSALLPQTRPVGVMVAIHNLAGGTYDSTASGDWALISSAGVGSPLFIRHGICQTPLTDFESLISAGEARSGCVGFSVARAARILGVRFSPHSRAPGAVRWR
jgi:hypothetical protein